MSETGIPGNSTDLLIELTGQTDFNLGNRDGKIEVDIAVGYRRKGARSGADTEQTLFASLTARGKSITLHDLIKCCTDKPVEVPDLINAIGFRKFYVSYGTGGLKATEFTFQFDSRIEINKRLFDVTLAITYDQKKTGDSSFSFTGILHVGTHHFDLQFTKKNNEWLLYASYRHDGSATIDLKAIAARLFGESETAKMPPLSFTLSKFKAFLLYKKAGVAPALLLGMGAGVELNLKDLPLAGAVLSQDNSFAFQEVLVLYSSGSFSKDLLAKFPGLPQENIEKGFNISAALLINGKPATYILNGGEAQKFPVAKPIVAGGEPVVASPAKLKDPTPVEGSMAAAVSWTDVDKKIGPVTLQRLGFGYKDGKVIVLLDASMEMAGMGMQLIGFGLGFELKWPPSSPDFYIDGIGLSYKVPPIEIAGAFLHSKQQDPKHPGNTIDVYTGGAVMKISWFTISAIGSYAKVKDDNNDEVASLFIYGVFDGPIGGPSFFFVTGIAAGFGYNRKVNTPSIEEVAMFPLVALAMKPEQGGSLMDVLARLETKMKNGKKPIEISIGDYWLAIGIKFSSFKIIDSFVLVTVNFGTSLEFAVLGLSRLKWPDESIAKGLGTIVYVELAILVHFGPASDAIAVEALITPNSFLFSRDCKLTGGFAFYAWIKGEHEGDFVITLGGYHTKFRKPPHYPVVPRLGLSWKIGDLLLIRGEMYFAICSSAIMAGGRWEVLFKTSVVSVTLVIWADMLISWAPFSYEIQVGVCLVIDLHILIHIHIELSARLYIAGPPFAGEIYVDLSIFSFTIPFGDRSTKPPDRLSLAEFADGFMPRRKIDKTTNGNAAPAPAPVMPGNLVAGVAFNGIAGGATAAAIDAGVDPINITITDGLIEVKSIGANDKFPVINPYQLAISVESFVPSTQVFLNQGVNELPAATPLKTASGAPGINRYDKREIHVGIRPCRFTSAGLQLKMIVSLTGEKGAPDVKVTCLAKGVAQALWGPEASGNNNSNPGTSKVISNVLTGLLLQPAASAEVSAVRDYDFSLLLEKKNAPDFVWAFSQPKVGAKYSIRDVLGYNDGTRHPGTLETNYSQSRSRRATMMKLLQKEFDSNFPGIMETEMQDAMFSSEGYFTAAPVLCNMGEIPQYP